MPSEKSFLSFFRKKSTDNLSNGSEKAQKQNEVKKNISPPAVQDNDDLKYTVYDFIRTIRDPEKPATLEDLNVVYEDGISVNNIENTSIKVVRVEFNPTVPHCSLATLIGLCIRIKLERSIPYTFKLDIYIKKGAHTTEEEINKQINDKERIAAAMENPSLKEMVEKCIIEED